jgi:NTE family protein
VNRSVVSCRAREGEDPFRWVDVLWLRPSMDIGALAAELANHVPPVVRYLMRGLGTDESISELVSYLLFDPAFTTKLIDAGRADARAAKAEILRFMAGGTAASRAR